VAGKLLLVLEYQGTNYQGFQLQKQAPTIQGELEKALYKLTQEKIRVIAASRTDSGVHARGQVVTFGTKSKLEADIFINGLNYYLPADIAVREARWVSETFNPRRDARSREYQYSILNRATRSPMVKDFSYLVRGDLDTGAMNEAGARLIGEHDFASFASQLGAQIKITVRTVHRAEMVREGDMVIFHMMASSFLPHQVRNTVGTLIRVGQGKMTLEEFCSIIGLTKPGLAGPMVPASGLCLMRVNYPG
jgi:tRNA pseudouridine38-40 synthase